MKIKQKNFDLHSLRCDLGYKLDSNNISDNEVDNSNALILFLLNNFIFSSPLRVL